MTTDLLPADGLILCAVSGGADSTYLLCRLRAMGYSVAAAHYNHGLRGEFADRDEAFVRGLCRRLDIPFIAERGDAAGYAAAHRMGTEEAARVLRYAFYERAADALGASVIATAHTADDNAETVLMNLTRGAALRGLCGIPPVRGRIVRPMLDETHEDALSYLSAHGIDHVEDETNALDDAARNRVRHRVMPALRAENPLFAGAVFRASSLLREDEAYLSRLAEGFVRENAEDSRLPAAALTALPRPIALRVIRIMAGAGLSFQQAQAVLDIAASGGYADVSGMRVGVSCGQILFGVKERKPLPERALIPGVPLRLPEAGLWVICDKIDVLTEDVYKSFNIFFIKCENICGNMTVAARRGGDALRPPGRGVAKSVKRLFLEARIPVWERETVPVIRDGAGVLAVYGVGADERACALPGDRDVFRIEFSREDR